MLKTEAIQRFLSTVGNEHLTNLYTSEMEVQVNVARDKGERTGGVYLGKRWVGWTDGSHTWKSFRIPWNANIAPTYVDRPIDYNTFVAHVEGVGMTGWNWVRKNSVWVGFDFDSIINHKTGLQNEELEKIKEMVYDVPYTTVVKSTSGKGIHVYIELSEGVPTATHTEHAAIARSLLSVLSMDCGYNFFNSVDACGMVLWCYHRKQENTDGLTLVKKGKPFDIKRLPSNWKEHIPVTSGRNKTIQYESNEAFNELAASIKKHYLNTEHKKLLNWLTRNTSPDRDSWWDNEHNMLVCHTLDLKKAHAELGLRGIFYTNTSGSTRQNCYAFPASGGSWMIRRHSRGVQEHPSWQLDQSGWTRCVYNTIADLHTCARANGGIENSRGEYVFATVAAGLKALHDAGIHKVTLSTWEDYPVVKKRTMYMKEKKDGKIIISFQKLDQDEPPPNFIATTRGDRWESVIQGMKRRKEINAPDHLIRHVITDESEAGWWIFTRDKWVQQNKGNVATVLLSQSDTSSRSDIELAMAKAILDPWELINIPFAEEYPGDRKWNRNAAQLSIKPAEGACDTWMNVLTHIAKNLDDEVRNNNWCIANAINDGKEYLLCWISSMIQQPTEPLPYLFLVGPQNCGKSTLHEALNMLMTRGCSRADNALINQQGFNAEIANAVLCVVEEINLSKNKDAANRIKDWVTGRTISINTKHKTVYDIQNTSHWIQCANEIDSCPIFPGDTRIVVLRVEKPKMEIPKIELFNRLEKEKAAFLNLITSIELPETDSRLALPCLQSSIKAQIERTRMSALAQFMDENVYVRHGWYVEFDDFYHEFQKWLEPSEREKWTKTRVGRAFPSEPPICKGRMGGESTTVCGNITLDPYAKDLNFEFYLDANRRINRRVYHD